jgi:hypothetical protein
MYTPIKAVLKRILMKVLSVIGNVLREHSGERNMSKSGANRRNQNRDHNALMTSERGLSAKVLKWIAMITMIIDHAAQAIIVPFFNSGYFSYHLLDDVYQTMRIIGRLSFPLFIFLIVDSFFYTRDRRRFVRGLLIFALISELPFDIVVTIPIWGQNAISKDLLLDQNIFFTLLIGVLCLMFSEYVFHGAPALISDKEVQNRQKKKGNTAPERPLAVSLLLVALITAAGCGLAYILHVDYGMYGVLAIVLAYLIRRTGHRKLEIFGIVLATVFSSIYELFGLLSGLAMFASNGKRGNIRHKWFYYIFYPGHLAVLACIKLMIIHYAGVI